MFLFSIFTLKISYLIYILFISNFFLLYSFRISDPSLFSVQYNSIEGSRYDYYTTNSGSRKVVIYREYDKSDKPKIYLTLENNYAIEEDSKLEVNFSSVTFGHKFSPGNFICPGGIGRYHMLFYDALDEDSTLYEIYMRQFDFGKRNWRLYCNHISGAIDSSSKGSYIFIGYLGLNFIHVYNLDSKFLEDTFIDLGMPLCYFRATKFKYKDNSAYFGFAIVQDGNKLVILEIDFIIKLGFFRYNFSQRNDIVEVGRNISCTFIETPQRYVNVSILTYSDIDEKEPVKYIKLESIPIDDSKRVESIAVLEEKEIVMPCSDPEIRELGFMNNDRFFRFNVSCWEKELWGIHDIQANIPIFVSDDSEFKIYDFSPNETSLLLEKNGKYSILCPFPFTNADSDPECSPICDKVTLLNYLEHSDCIESCGNTTNHNGYCTCEEGKYLDIDDMECGDCNENCLRCDRKNENDMGCDECKEGRIKFGNNCYPEYTSNNKTFILPSGSISSCHELDPNYGIRNNTMFCANLASTGKSLLMLNSITGLFEYCDQNCKTCEGTFDHCTSCYIDSYNSYLQEGKCVHSCDKGYYSKCGEKACVCEKCYDTCETCIKGPVSNKGKLLEMNCMECKIGYFKIESLCFPQENEQLKTFDSSLIPALRTKKSCADFFDLSGNSMVIYSNSSECIKMPDNVFYLNEKNGIIDNCDSMCNGCRGYPEVINNEEDNTNDANQTENDSTKTINYHCKSCNDTSLFLEYENCVSQCSSGKTIDNTNICNVCHPNCLTCSSPPTKNINGLLENMNCLSCSNDYMFVNSFCFPFINRILGIFDTSIVNSSSPLGSCYDYKNSLGERLTVLYNESECIERPIGTFFVNKNMNYGVVKKCVSGCLECDKGFDEETGEGNCLKCKDKYLEIKGNCFSECPSGYVEEINEKGENYCEEKIDFVPIIEEKVKVVGQNEECKVYEYDYNGHLLKEANEEKIGETIQEIGNLYITDPGKSPNLVEINRFLGDNRISISYSDIKCAKIISQMYGLTYIDLSNIQERLLSSYSSGYPFYYTQLTNGSSTSVKVLSNKGEIINLNTLNETKITISRVIKNETLIGAAREVALLCDIEVDLTDPDDPFFNDICFPYENADNKDVPLAERRADYFIGESCESGCESTGFDEESGRINCECPLSSEENGAFTRLQDMVIDNFPIKIDINNLKVIKCYKIVFDPKTIIKNLGFYVLLALIGAQIPEIILFINKGIIPILDYVLKEKDKKMEKKKDNISDEDSNTDEEEVVEKNENKDSKNLFENDDNIEEIEQIEGKENIMRNDENRQRPNLRQYNIKNSKQNYINDLLCNIDEKDVSSKRELVSSREQAKQNVSSVDNNMSNVSNINLIPFKSTNSIKENEETINKFLGHNPPKKTGIKGDVESEKTIEEDGDITIVKRACTKKSVDLLRFRASVFKERDKASSLKMKDANSDDGIEKTKRELNHATKRMSIGQTVLENQIKEVNNISNISNSKSGISQIVIPKFSNSVEVDNVHLGKLRKKNDLIENSINNIKRATTYNYVGISSKDKKMLKRASKFLGLDISMLLKIKEKGGDIQKVIEDERELDSDDLDELDFEDALEKDKRCICVFYWHIIKGNLIFLNVFANISVFEPFVLKLLGMFLSLGIFFFTNAMFFSDKYISERYKMKDGVNGFAYILENEIEKSIYSSVCGFAVQILINFLCSAKKKFENLIKRSDKLPPEEFTEELNHLLKMTKLKFYLFLFLDILLMLFFFYFCIAWCGVYHGTQLDWLESGLISLVFSLLMYSIIYFILTLMRYMGFWLKVQFLYSLASNLLNG